MCSRTLERRNKPFNEVCESISKQLNKIMKTIQDIRIEFDKEIKSLKKNQTEKKLEIELFQINLLLYWGKLK